MESLIQADIFFFISSISFIILTVLLSIALFYFIKTGKNLFFLSEKLKNHFQNTEEYFFNLKENLENNPILRFLFPIKAKNNKKPKNTTKKKTKNSDK